jgi:hypothetical protein
MENIIEAAELQQGVWAYFDRDVSLEDEDGRGFGQTAWLGLARVEAVAVEDERVRVWVEPDDSPRTSLYLVLGADEQLVVKR